MAWTIVKIVAAVAAGAASVLVIVASRKPDAFTVQRRITINAPREKIFALIDDFRCWTSWSPWEKKNPAMKRTYGGAATGRGATYAWEGNRNVGSGRMEIVDASTPSHLSIKLDFLKPFEGHNLADFTLEPIGSATAITWTMRGPSPLLYKVMDTLMNMDKMIGNDFDAGLANLKTLAERE